MESLADLSFLYESHENSGLHTRVHVGPLYIRQASQGVAKLLKLKQK